MCYLDDSVAKLTYFEGSVRWLYLDTAGLVTVGVGEMLANPAAACHVLFNGPSGPATEDEIIADYQRVKAMQPGLVASAYYVDGALTVLPYDIKNMLLKHVIYFDGALAQFYRGYARFPDGIRLALIDLAFNLGISKLEKQYPTFNAAVNRGDWTTAAAQCHRNGPSAERNEWCKQQFLAAVPQEVS